MQMLNYFNYLIDIDVQRKMKHSAHSYFVLIAQIHFLNICYLSNLNLKNSHSLKL